MAITVDAESLLLKSKTSWRFGQLITVNPESAGWEYTGLHVVHSPPASAGHGSRSGRTRSRW